LIVNPVASRANARTLEQAVLALAPCRVEVVTTERSGQAGELARESIDLGHDAVVVLAGDGTANDARPPSPAAPERSRSER
jgi:diacylglycerol kinase family enzyme